MDAWPPKIFMGKGLAGTFLQRNPLLLGMRSLSALIIVAHKRP